MLLLLLKTNREKKKKKTKSFIVQSPFLFLFSAEIKKKRFHFVNLREFENESKKEKKKEEQKNGNVSEFSKSVRRAKRFYEGRARKSQQRIQGKTISIFLKFSCLRISAEMFKFFLKDLDIAIVKATNHVECPPKERHVRSKSLGFSLIEGFDFDLFLLFSVSICNVDFVL